MVLRQICYFVQINKGVFPSIFSTARIMLASSIHFTFNLLLFLFVWHAQITSNTLIECGILPLESHESRTFWCMSSRRVLKSRACDDGNKVIMMLMQASIDRNIVLLPLQFALSFMFNVPLRRQFFFSCFISEKTFLRFLMNIERDFNSNALMTEKYNHHPVSWWN